MKIIDLADNLITLPKK